MNKKIHYNSCCPKCGAALEIDIGSMGSYFDPPEPPYIICTECEWEPDMDNLDWSDFDRASLTPKQMAQIERIRLRADRYRTILFHPANRHILSVDDLFSYAPEGDFSWEGEPEDVGNAWNCGDSDCETGWHQSCQYIEMGRKDGKTWYSVYLDSFVGDCDYQPDGGWDEREGDTPSASVLADLWFSLEGRSIDHFHGWCKYDLDVAITGKDPLANWTFSRDTTPHKAIKAALGNLKYLHKMVMRIKKNK